MQSGTTNGFFYSAVLHGTVIALILLGTYLLQDQAKKAPAVFELVAGEGDNYAATEAPLLGVPGGEKVAMPEPPAPKPSAPQPTPVQTTPIEATPLQPATVPEHAPETKPAPAQTKPAPDAIPDFKKSVTRISKKRETRIIQKYKKEQEAAEKKAAAEALRNKRLTKEEFDKQNVASRTGGSGVRHIDTEGIRSGVVGGSANNKTGGAGGTALTREEGDEIEAYNALLGRKIKEVLDEKPGVSAGLVVEVEIRIMPSGAITGIRITKSSGSADFDQAAKEALASIHMPPRPKGLDELQRFPIRGTD